MGLNACLDNARAHTAMHDVATIPATAVIFQGWRCHQTQKILVLAAMTSSASQHDAADAPAAPGNNAV